MDSGRQSIVNFTRDKPSRARAPRVNASISRFVRDDGVEGYVQLRSHLPEFTMLWGFASASECFELVNTAKSMMRDSLVASHEPNCPTPHPSRTSQDACLERSMPGVVTALERRIATVCNWPEERSTGFQVIRYGPGQIFHPHLDCVAGIDNDESSSRIATLILYLNTPSAGGETRFVDAGLTISPIAGQAILFAYPSRRRASMTLHAGEPISEGEKWIATKWFHAF